MPNLNLRPRPGTPRLLAFVILVFSFFDTFSQDHRISISSSYNIPLGELSWTYAPGMGIKLNYSSIDVKRTGRSRAIGLSIGYSIMPALSDTLYYVVDKGGVDGTGIGTAVYSAFKMFHLDGTIDWGFPLGKKTFFTPGLSLGLLYGKRVTVFEDSFGAVDGSDEFVTWINSSAQVGIQQRISDHISITPFVAYNFIIQTGNTNPAAIDYNENTGMFYHFYSPGVSLNYSF